MKQIIALMLCAMLLAGCSSGSQGQSTELVSSVQEMADSAVSSVPASSVQTVQAADPTPQPTPTVLPLTGLPAEGEAMRPVAVMLNNSTAVTAQWGVADADVMMEARTEGKQTNLCLWFSSLNSMPKTGPIGEGKDLFWQFAIAQNALLSQKGMTRYAENLLNCYSYQPIDALYVGVNSYDYDHNLTPGVPEEFHWYTRGSSLAYSLAGYGLSAAGSSAPMFRFGQANGGTAGAAEVRIAYSAESGAILRYNAELGLWQMYRTYDIPMTDVETGAHAGFTNLFLLNCPVGLKDDKFTRNYDLTGGTGWYLTGDFWQPITWKKGDVTQPLVLYDANGSELTVNTGRSYVGFYGIPDQKAIILSADGTELVHDAVTVPMA
ncbi:MAG: DUF3048 C-terminal domain-containing protein [Faecalibacterium sp.]|nr:DUF3048 C-terminal domain-containing protein [Faecalibacterium sp.]